MGLPTMVMGGATQLVRTSDLFVRFNAICGDCHVSAANGGRHADETTFATVFDETWLVHIKSDDPSFYMPPPPRGKPYSARGDDDPVVDLVRYLEAWLAQGRPADMFTIEATASAGGSYAFTPDVAAAMTNLGTCVPSPGAFASSTSGMMESMDQQFASASELPASLADTDLTTFDSSVLAATGVVSYVPTYPLWSAGSGKLRHIRVPRGQSIRFDKAAQTFDIPPNTRFYKTFFRKVIDRTGQVRNRKMETRVIVARPDSVAPDGTTRQNALFGTYIWSEDETVATLANVRYRDETTHADQVITYETDELTYQHVVDSLPTGANVAALLKKAVAEVPGLEMHYSVPGRLRCVQCHMGSPTKNFVLGFFPLQVARRASGTAGTYEPTGDDELTQLQRLIDYGVISGIDSPGDVLALEDSQLPRKARTDGELKAQAYMIGNCAHCHNPRGLPSVTKPELASVLNFLPSTDGGGVFEFPLERTSPIRFRGAGGDVPVPYVTPSLYDYPVTTKDLVRMDNHAAISASASDESSINELTWTPKFDASNGIDVGSCSADNKFSRGYCGDRKTGLSFVPAPWRSLIYRNVDTPFPYFDDYVPFPHMPMNGPGFDCRAPRIMGEWMVGLPAARKSPQIEETVLPKITSKPGDGTYDSNPQPYVEVKEGDPGYAAAVAAAAARLQQYEEGVRYNYCEDVLGGDILDPIGAPSGAHLPDSTRFVFGQGTPVVDPRDPTSYLPVLGVPYHSHWFNYDPTDPPPPWSPRRPDWKNVLPAGSPPDVSFPSGYGDQQKADATAYRQSLIPALNEAQLTDQLEAYATTPLPVALWQVKPECQQQLAAPAIKKVSDLSSSPPAWIARTRPAASAPVYMSAPGEMLYRHICFNCHGPKKDGRGLQGDALAASSEGEARPANFRDGLFGPSSDPGANLRAEFTLTPSGTDAFGWASRYMAWMTLGGTLQIIPDNIIRQVEATRTFGLPRPNLKYVSTGAEASANMLTLAKNLCSAVLPEPPTPLGGQGHYFTSPDAYPPFDGSDAPFIDTNGDKELWLTLCSRFSPPVVRVYAARFDTQDKLHEVVLDGFYYATGADPGSSYPPDAPVGDQDTDATGQTQVGVDPNRNFYPACILRPAGADEQAQVDAAVKVRHSLPYCPGPEAWSPRVLAFGVSSPLFNDKNVDVYRDNILRWKLRGAIAAGMAVFSYLATGGAQMPMQPYYNECQLLPK